MKKSLILAVILFLLSHSGSTQNCVINCNLTTSYVCPNTTHWRANASIYEDNDLMKELGYKKDKQGCWRLEGSTNRTIRGNKNKLKQWFDKLKQKFQVTKTGF